MNNYEQNEALAMLDSIPEANQDREMGLGDDVSLLKMLLDKDEVLSSEQVPEVIKNMMIWYNKTVALSNIERKDIFNIVEGLRDTKVATLMARKKSEFTWEEEIYWSAFIRWLKIESTRGVDGFERAMEATQIQQISTDQRQQLSQNSGGGGLMNSMGNMLRGSMGKRDL